MNIPRPEFPRPQFVRSEWMNLNGQWQFEIDNGRSGESRGIHKEGVALSGEIIVPFCPESKLSGVNYLDFMYGVWYKRKVTLPEAWTNENRRTVTGGGREETIIETSVTAQVVAYLNPDEGVDRG